MARDGFFTGLDIGTSTIKILVAEFINGDMNVIGVSNVKSAGVKDGVIIDIDAAAKSIRVAIEQAEEKSGITIEKVNVGLPANLLKVEPTQGMIPVSSDSKEIKDEDVESVIKSALTKSLTPEREVISLVPEEFIIDGFQGIRDPRGMMGVRMEMRGVLYTGPTTILHNLRKTVEKAGIKLENIIISPLSLTRSVLNEGEREFGATVIDMGAGQTTVAVMRNQELQFTTVYQEGGDYVTKDISKVLKTSLQSAEAIKANFGNANVAEASLTETVQVEVVGENQPADVTERFLSEIISARFKHILDRVYQDLSRNRNLELPGGVILVGGSAIMPGIVELAHEVLGVNVKLYVPNQVGIRNPMFANVISLVEYAGTQSEVDAIAQAAIAGEERLRRKPADVGQTRFGQAQFDQVQSSEQISTATPLPTMESQEPSPKANKPKLLDRARNYVGGLFD